MKIVSIVQARMESARLPGKVLMDIEGQTMLARVIERTKRARMLDDIIVATTDRPADIAIVEACEQVGVAVFRGDSEDVLDRYYQTAQTHKADIIVRITSDCPLIEPNIIDQIIATFLQNKADYASNTITRSFPRGLDTEVFSTGALERAWREAEQQYYREHVTPYFYQNPSQFNLKDFTNTEDFSNLRWTVDRQKDLIVVRRIYSRLPADRFLSWREIVKLVYREPELLTINSDVQQKPVQMING